jgi:Hyphally regulated cell wall protein N-terminal
VTTTAQLGLLGWWRSARSRGRAKSRRFRPAICGLEERQLLSTFTWDSRTGGVFNNAQNWIDQNGHHGVPGAADTAVITGSGFTVAVYQATTVGSLSSNAQIAIHSGSLTLDGSGQGSSIASLLLYANTTLAVAEGSLDLSGNSTLAGTLDAASGTTIVFGGGNQYVNAGAVFSGPGAYVLNDGPDGSWIVNGSITAPANFDFEGGTLDLVGTLSIPCNFTWTGGALEGCGTAVVEPGASLTIVTGATSSLQNDAVLVNDGTVTWCEAGGQITGSGAIDNCGTFNIDGQDPLQQPFSNPIDGTFNNSGWLAVSGALPTIDSLNSTGTVDVTNDGYLTIAGNSTLSGVINADAGTTVSFYGSVNNQGLYIPGVATVNVGTAFEGSGFYAVFDGESLVLDTNVAPANFLIAGGTVAGSGSLAVTNYLQFSGGEIACAAVSIPATATFSIDNSYDDSGYGWIIAADTVNLAGTTYWNTPGVLALGGQTTINNMQSGIFTIQCDQPMTSGAFNNQGVIAKVYDSQTSTGNGTTGIGTTFNSTGSVQVDSGVLVLGGPVAQMSNGVLTGGAWSVVDATGAGAGLVISSAGGITTIGPGVSVTLDGPGTYFANLASLSVNEGAFFLLGGQAFETQGSLANYGTIYLGAGDALGVSGNYGQAPSATLDMTIAGRPSSGLVSQLSIAGDAYFGGTLNIIVPSGFTPVVDDRYTPITYRHVRSFFGAINVSPLPGGEYFSINYLPNALYFRVR